MKIKESGPAVTGPGKTTSGIDLNNITPSDIQEKVNQPGKTEQKLHELFGISTKKPGN